MASMDLLTPHLPKVKLPQPGQLVYKDECVYSFDDPESETGLYVSLSSFLGYGRNYVEQYFQKTGNAVFLHIQREKKPAPEPEKTGDGPEKKITRLAIGVEGGFDPDCGRNKFVFTDHYSVVLLPGFHTWAWPEPALPEPVRKSAQAVVDAESPFKIAEREALEGTWDGERREVSVHALELQQLDNGVRVSPGGWRCERCDLTANLWLNLTDGSILCGRKFFDGSGGNDHAVEHYRATGYPLAVKLGTITADGGDVFSYAEDDMVTDPKLDLHLRHFGINVATLHKTEKSMAELELELNQRTEWALEQGGAPLAAAGLTGLHNLGNSCYINSVMQMVFRIPSFARRYVEGAPDIFGAFPDDPVNDFDVQTCKLGVALASGRHASVRPAMFRRVVARQHREFSSRRQQDAHEFYLHLLTLVERHSRHQRDPGAALALCVEERVRCGGSGGVRYSRRPERHLPLPVPLAAAGNAAQVREYEARRAAAEQDKQRLDPSELVRPQIPFQACLEALMKEEAVEHFYSTAAGCKVTAHKTTRLASFPDYLLIQLKKFTVREDWTPAKLDVAVDMPWEMDLGCLRGRGLQPGEVPLPEEPAGVAGAAPPPPRDAALMAQLLDMGFPAEACQRALHFTSGADLGAASRWLMDHINDWDFATPFQPPAAPAAQAPVDEAALEQITGMGFTRPQAMKALAATGGDVGRAVDWIFSHADDLDHEGAAEGAPGGGGGLPRECTDGPTKYKLIAFITHMGPSSAAGHYVCHALHGPRWVLFNDDHVVLSENPPKDLGYLYLYERL